jgi:hypothetical protein
MITDIPPAEISLERLLLDLKKINIVFKKRKRSTAKHNKSKQDFPKNEAEATSSTFRQHAKSALRDEVKSLSSTPEGSRNDQLNKSAFKLGQFVAVGALDENGVVTALSEAAEYVGLDHYEIERTIRSGLEAGTKCLKSIDAIDETTLNVHPDECQIVDQDADFSEFEDLPTIIIDEKHMQEITEEALDALVKSNDPPRIFVRGGCINRIRPTEKGTLTIEVLTEPMMRGILARSACYMKYDKGGTLVKADPPTKVVKDALALGVWRDLPIIEGIIESPSVRPDGTIIDQAGYDRVTKLFYDPSQGLEDLVLPESPSQLDAKDAVEFIFSEILIDFPFVDDASKANALAAMLSVIIRPAIDGNIPLALFDKPKPGTGASLLIEIISSITTGRPAEMISAPDNEEEWRKLITSCLLTGSQLIAIDNISKTLASSSLAKGLTCKTWRDRILGHSKVVDLPQRAVWLGSGNNIAVGGDIPRRAYRIRIDAKMPQPWLRDDFGFKHPDLLGWVRDLRKEALGALLTMVKAWFEAGQPQAPVAAMGGFDEWAKKMAGVLQYAGVSGFLTNNTEFQDTMNQEDLAWDAFLLEWSRLHADNPITSAALREELTSTDLVYKSFRESMPEDVAEAVNKRSEAPITLGKVLAKRVDQVTNSGLKLERGPEDTHKKIGTWRVIQTSLPDSAVDAGYGKSPSKDGFAGSAGNAASPKLNLIRTENSMRSEEDSCQQEWTEQLPASPANACTDNDSDMWHHPQIHPRRQKQRRQFLVVKS